MVWFACIVLLLCLCLDVLDVVLFCLGSFVWFGLTGSVSTLFIVLMFAGNVYCLMLILWVLDCFGCNVYFKL